MILVQSTCLFLSTANNDRSVLMFYNCTAFGLVIVGIMFKQPFSIGFSTSTIVNMPLRFIIKFVETNPIHVWEFLYCVWMAIVCIVFMLIVLFF